MIKNYIENLKFQNLDINMTLKDVDELEINDDN